MENSTASYESFLPRLPKDWLEASIATKSSDEISEKDIELSSSPLGSGRFVYPAEGPFTRQFSRGSESGFESNYTQSARQSRRTSLSISPFFSSTRVAPRTAAVPEVNTARVDTIFQEMKKRISEAEASLRNLYKSEDEGFSEEDLDQTRTVVSIRNEQDYHTIDIQEKYRSDEDQLKSYRSAFGILCQLKRGLKDENARLDNLAEIYSSEDESVRNQYDSKREEFRIRINSNLKEIECAISKIRDKNSMLFNGIRYKGIFPESLTLNKVKKAKTSCHTWLHGFLLGTMMSLLSFLYLWNLKSDEFKHWVIIIRLVRSPLIILLLLYLYAINMKVWAKYHINYVAIFNHHPDSIPTPAGVLSMADFLTISISVLVVAVIMTSSFGSMQPIKSLTLVMWGLLGLFLLSPFLWFQRKMRFRFISVVIEILLAPFVGVTVTHICLADHFLSIVAVFLDIQYFACYIFSDSWTSTEVDTAICTSSGNGIRPIILLLPATWRMLQCLRCYYGTWKVEHLINAAKYFTTFPVIVFATLYSTYVKGNIFELSVDETASWFLVMWAVSALIHCAYTFLWDVCKDWNLWDITTCKIFHRQLLFKAKSLYIAVIILDLILRFTWIFKLTLAIVWQVYSDLLYTGMFVYEEI